MSASQLPAARQPATEATRKATRAAWPAATVLGRYHLSRRLGSGSFGTVWAAHDERLDREVAVKIVPRERVLGGRLEREARAAARLSHPAIVTLYEAAIDEDGAYLVSELVQGTTLDDLLDQGRLSDRDVLGIAVALCDALAHAHAQGVIHRDVKPSNILVPERPSSPAHPAKLTDFGVARVLGGDTLTRTGDIIGTAAYMAPEQAEGREAGAAADLYALALVVYEALTGINPISTSAGARRARRLGVHLPPLRRQRRDLPGELGIGIDLALRPRPRERGSLAELRGALVASLPQVDDTPGVITGGWTRSHAVKPAGPSPEFLEPSATQSRQPGASQFGFDGERRRGRGILRPSAPVAWPVRALHALTAGISAAWLSTHLLTGPPLAPSAAGVLAAILVLFLPALGWLGVVGTLTALTAVQGRAGGALVLAGAALIPVVLAPRRAGIWAISAAAVALGPLGLAGAWPALAARAGRTMTGRAILGITGWAWLVAASALLGQDLYATRPPGLPGPTAWTTSLTVALHQVVSPILSTGLLAPALVWAMAAVTLPWLTRLRALPLQLAAITVWASVTVAGTEATIRGFGGSEARLGLHGAPPGAIVAGLIAIAPALLAVWRAKHRTESRGAGLS
ncbi:MAG: serine/threonine-protein kinase [Solirubrobacteraceae bacterium]